MNRLLLFFFLSISLFSMSQSKEKVPSYFGIQIRPVFPTQFIGTSILTLTGDGFESTIEQKLGYSFGGTVRAGVTKLIAIETGINYTERNFDLTMSVPDSNLYATNDLTFIEYDVPVNVLTYIQLSQAFYMNASVGATISFKPTNVGVYNQPNGYHAFRNTGIPANKIAFGINANVGFEYRTKEKGFFYIGGSARVPFAPLFSLYSDYNNQGNQIRHIGEVDGSFLTIDFKYFFPNIKNKGPQFQEGPIE